MDVPQLPVYLCVGGGGGGDRHENEETEEADVGKTEDSHIGK